jgi:hypothetical protein
MGGGVDERQSGDGFGRLTAGKSPHSMRGETLGLAGPQAGTLAPPKNGGGGHIM